jgi:hypothetical protein
MWICCSLLALAVGLERAPAQPPAVPGLIAQLGSPRFKEREAATQALDRLGPAALESLRRAAQQPDPEIRHRAEALVQEIELRMETAEALIPKQVHLVYDAMPIDEAIEDFARKTGFPIQRDAHRGPYGRTVTLDTGATTFWRAFDAFCQKAGVREGQAAVNPSAVAEQTVRIWNANGMPMQAVMVARGGVTTGEVSADGRLMLVDARPPEAPTYYAGSVRIRALPRKDSSWANMTQSNERSFVLEVTPQPKMAWQGLQHVRIDRAVDDRGRVLAQADSRTGATPPEQVVLGNRVVIVEGTHRVQISDLRQRLVSLAYEGDSPALLKEVHGTVTARVRTPLRVLASVDNILNASGRTVQGPNGDQFKIVSAKRLATGEVSLHLQVVELPQVGGAWVARAAMVRRRQLRVMNAMPSVNFIREAMLGGDLNFTLLDAHGNRYSLESTGSHDPVNTPWGEAELLFRPKDGQGEASRLTYWGRRDIIIEIPFTLKDVPLS